MHTTVSQVLGFFGAWALLLLPLYLAWRVTPPDAPRLTTETDRA